MPRPRRREAIVAAALTIVLGVLLIGWLLLRDVPPSGAPLADAPHPSSPEAGSATDREGGQRRAPNGARPDPAASSSSAPGSRPAGRSEAAGAGAQGPPPAPSPAGRAAPGEPSGTIEGRIERTTDNTPVAGAQVRLWGGGPSQHALPAVRASAQGRFRITNLPLGRYTLIPSGDDLEGRSAEVRLPRDGATVRVVLRVGGRTTLRFVPRPRKGDRVRLRLRVGNGEETATLDDGGHLSDLYVGVWDLAYRAADGRFATGSIALDPGENTMRLDLREPGKLEVDARDAAGKRVEVEVKLLPLAQPAAIVGPREFAWIEKTTYTIRRARALAIPAGRYLVTAAPVLEDYAPAHAAVDVPPGRKVTVPIRLEPAAAVEVTIEPGLFPGQVGLYGPRGWSIARPTRRGDPLRITGIAERSRGVLIAWDAQRGRAGQVEVTPGARPTLQLEPIGGVRVQVLRAGSSEGAGLRVRCLLAKPTVVLSRGITTPAPPRERPGALVVYGLTDSSGVMAEKLPPGRWTISAEGVSTEVTVPTRTTVEATLRLPASD